MDAPSPVSGSARRAMKAVKDKGVLSEAASAEERIEAIFSGRAFHALDDLRHVIRCPNCNGTGGFLCARCMSASYCSKACQSKHWSKHKPLCADKSLSASDVLEVREGRLFAKLDISAGTRLRVETFAQSTSTWHTLKELEMQAAQERVDCPMLREWAWPLVIEALHSCPPWLVTECPKSPPPDSFFDSAMDSFMYKALSLRFSQERVDDAIQLVGGSGYLVGQLIYIIPRFICSARPSSDSSISLTAASPNSMPLLVITADLHQGQEVFK